MDAQDEEQQLRSVALENARAILTARRQAEDDLLATREALRESNERLTDLLESIPDGFVALDEDWRFSYINARARTTLRLLHPSPAGLIGCNAWWSFPDLLGTEFERNARRSAEERSPLEFEFLYPRLDAWYRIRISPGAAGVSVFFREITARKRTDEALREREELLRATFAQAAVGIAVARLDGQLVELNERFCAMLGYSAEELRGMTVLDITHPDHMEETRDYFRRLLAGEFNHRIVEKRYLRKDGSAVWSSSTITLMKDASGQPKQVIGVIEDITQRKLAEVERARLWSVLEKSLNEIYVFDIESLQFQYVNRGALLNLGYSPETMRELTPLDLKPEFTEESFRQMIGPLLRREQEKLVFYTVHRRRDGSEYPVEVHLQTVDHAGERVFLAVILDITERRKSEQAVRRSEEEMRALADSIPQLAWMAEPDGELSWYNRRWYEYTGTRFEEVRGWGWKAVHDPEMLPRVIERWQQSVRTGEPFEMEFPLRGADGLLRWFLTRAVSFRDAHGRVLRWFGTATDVDQVRQVREALRDETRVLELLNRSGAAIASQLELQVLVQTVTDATTELSGARYGTFFYKVFAPGGDASWSYVLSGTSREALKMLGEPPATALFSPAFRGEGPIRCDDVLEDPGLRSSAGLHGMPPVPLRSYLAVPVISRSGEVIGGLFFGHPEPQRFTARIERIVMGIAAQAAVAIDNARLYEAAQKASEERHRLLESERAARAEAERMSELKDEFLATLSHELRTPLSAILGWSQLLRRRGALHEADVHRGLEVIERNARVQAELIDDLLDMSRITSGKLRLDVQLVDPTSFIQAALETVRPAANAKKIRLEVRLETDTGPIRGDAGRLQQVLWNLLSNAIKFTPEEGLVRLVMQRVVSQIEISVSDTGIGIQPDFLPHVFDRFRQADASTTRRFGGLGLGLSIVKRLVELHGGTVQVSSPGEGQGATFTVRLPLGLNQPDAFGAESPQPIDSSTVENVADVDLSDLRILVVDDEADARDVIRYALTERGAQTILAGSAEEALALMEQTPPDVLVSDIGMPGVDGFELLRRVHALRDGEFRSLPAIALTAFARSEDRAYALREGFLAHVSKPVEFGELVAAIARAVRRTG